MLLAYSPVFTFSSNYYLRIRLAELMQLELCHLFSEVTSYELSGAKGYTEWGGSLDQKPLSLSWEWMILGDGIIIPGPRPVTSNIMLIDAKGYDLGPECTAESLTTKITALDWARHIQELLAVH